MRNYFTRNYSAQTFPRTGVKSKEVFQKSKASGTLALHLRKYRMILMTYQTCALTPSRLLNTHFTLLFSPM
jgi:hypothetical protein